MKSTINFRRLDATKLLRALLFRFPIFGRRSCVVCGATVGDFLPHNGGRASAASLMKALNMVGSDLDNFECPRCFSHDRERHLLMYMEAAGLLAEIPGARILHVAPERRLARRLRALGPAHYIACDLDPSDRDTLCVNVMSMPFADASFDLLLANHVLEHVDDEIRALSEMFRVLKPGAHAVLQTPYSAKLSSTWSDPGIDDDNSRFNAYGQADHLRLFGKDIFARIESVGFVSCLKTHSELLPDADANRYGVNFEEPFFLFRRPL